MPVLLLLLPLLPLALAAEPLRLTQAAAEALADDDSLPALRASAADVDAAQAQVGAARAVENPSLTIGATRYSAASSLGAEWRLPLFGQQIASVHAAAAELVATQADADSVRAMVRAEIDQAWVGAWSAQAQAELALGLASDSHELLDAAQARFDVTEAPRTELLTARAAAARADAEAAGSAAERKAATTTLVHILGLEAVEIAGEPQTEIDGSLPSLLARLPQRPQARAATARSLAAQDRVHAARIAILPSLTLGAEADFGDPGLPGTDLLGLVALDLPLGGSAGPAIAAAKAEARRSEASAQDAARHRQAQLAASWYAWVADHARLKALDTQALPAAVESEALNEEAWRAGELDIAGLLAEKATLRALRKERVDAIAATALDRIAMLLIAGPTPTDPTDAGGPHAP